MSLKLQLVMKYCAIKIKEYKMGTFELKLYKKDNKFYLLTNLYNWSDKKLVDFAKLLEKYDPDAVIFDDNPAPGVHRTKHPRINDYKTVSRDLWGKGENKTVFVENINYHVGNCDLAMELVFNDPGSEFDGVEYVRFINVLTPQKVKLVLKNCPLYSDERELLESIMRHLNLPTDKESVDKEINNCVGLYELI